MQTAVIFMSKKAHDNLPFSTLLYSILHTISYQKMYIIRLPQFIPKKSLSPSRDEPLIDISLFTVTINHVDTHWSNL